MVYQIANFIIIIPKFETKEPTSSLINSSSKIEKNMRESDERRKRKITLSFLLLMSVG
jgi:hypothetical protein